MFLAYIVSLVLLLFAINNAWLTYMSGIKANLQFRNAEEGLNQVILKADEAVPLGAMAIDENPSSEQFLQYNAIAIIHSEKAGLYTSVLSEWSTELLDISVNKFSGPEPNENGNFVVMGHNYSGDAYFGSLHLLEIGDLISLTDQSGRTLIYSVYEILMINTEALEKLETNYDITLTMVTSDKDQLLWLVVKSKAIVKP